MDRGKAVLKQFMQEVAMAPTRALCMHEREQDGAARMQSTLGSRGAWGAASVAGGRAGLHLKLLAGAGTAVCAHAVLAAGASAHACHALGAHSAWPARAR